MNISQIMEKMIAFSNGNLHDMNHLMCVWTYAKTIGELEGLDRKTQETLEIAAITHDIACPLCREKYGNTNGKRQEEEGGPLVRSFLADAGLSAEQVDRVIADLAAKEGVDEQLKATDQLRWVGQMNSFKAAAEEQVLREIVYG